MEKRKRGKERRGAERLPIAVPIFARGLDERGKEFLEFTTTLNISASGALLAMRRSLPVGSAIALEIPAAPVPNLATRPRPVRNIQARIVRVVRSEPSYLWALTFSYPL